MNTEEQYRITKNFIENLNLKNLKTLSELISLKIKTKELLEEFDKKAKNYDHP